MADLAALLGLVDSCAVGLSAITFRLLLRASFRRVTGTYDCEVAQHLRAAAGARLQCMLRSSTDRTALESRSVKCCRPLLPLMRHNPARVHNPSVLSRVYKDVGRVLVERAVEEASWQRNPLRRASLAVLGVKRTRSLRTDLLKAASRHRILNCFVLCTAWRSATAEVVDI